MTPLRGIRSSGAARLCIRAVLSAGLACLAACSDNSGTTREPPEEVLVPCRVKLAFAGPLRAEIGDRITLHSQGNASLVYRWTVSPPGQGDFETRGRDADFVCRAQGNAILTLVATRDGLPCSELLHVPIQCLDPRSCTTLGDASVICGEPNLGLDAGSRALSSGADAASRPSDAGVDSGH